MKQRDAEIRRGLLEYYYDIFLEHPLNQQGASGLANKLGVEQQELEYVARR